MTLFPPQKSEPLTPIGISQKLQVFSKNVLKIVPFPQNSSTSIYLPTSSDLDLKLRFPKLNNELLYQALKSSTVCFMKYSSFRLPLTNSFGEMTAIF